MLETLGLIIIALGVAFWLWGTIWLPWRKSLLWKLHAIGVADTLGSVLILSGLLIRAPGNWRPLSLALLSIVFWGTSLSYILARDAGKQGAS